MQTLSVQDSIFRFLDKNKYRLNQMRIEMTKRKKKKKIKENISVVDSRYPYVFFNIDFNRGTKCQCGEKTTNNGLCIHMYKVLMDHYEIPVEYLAFLHLPEIYTVFLDILRDDLGNVNNKLKDSIDQYILDKNQECAVCCELISVGSDAYNFQQCHQCNNMTHTKCFQQWWNQKLTHPVTGVEYPKKCMYCRKEY